MKAKFSSTEYKEDDGINPKELLIYTLKFWKWILLCSLIGFFTAYFISLYTKDIYKIYTEIHIKEKENPLSNSNVSLAFNWGGNSTLIHAHIAILRSFTHNLKVVKTLKWEVEYYKKGKFFDKELYKNKPFTVVFDTNHKQLIHTNFFIEIENQKIILKISSQEKGKLFQYNNEKYSNKGKIEGLIKDIKIDEWIENENYRFKIIKNKYFSNQTKGIYYFKFIPYNYHAKLLSNSVSIEENKKGSSIIEISAKHPNKDKIIDYLNATVREIQDFEINEKNQMATNTIKFIEDQLKIIGDSLNQAELKLHLFKTKHEVFDIVFEAEKIFELYIELEKQRAELLNQKKYFVYTKNYIGENQDINNFLTPNITTIADPIFIRLIEHLTTLNIEKNKLEFSMEKFNPAIKENKNQIAKTKQTLQTNIDQLINNIQIQIEQVDLHISEVKEKLSTFPYTQQQLINLNRNYTLYNEQYTFLLQRKSEIGITRSASTPDTKVIDPAVDLDLKPIAPNRPKNYLLGILIGLFTPIGFIILKKVFNKKITNQLDLEKNTNISIIGVINNSQFPYNLVAWKNPKSSVTECFRTIRANLEFYLKENKNKQNIIAITSSIGGEGKTFCSINLASVIAISGNKTILVGLDLRKPKIFEDFNLKNNIGVTNYLIDKNKIDEIIQPSSYENLDILLSGPIPPNPSELLIKEKFNKLLTELKQKYDYIILDTAPIGIVADTIEILKKSDIGIYVVRENYTEKIFLDFINKQYKKNNIQNIAMLLNDSKQNKKYGYGYYEEDKIKKYNFF